MTRRTRAPVPLPVGMPPLVGALSQRLQKLPGVGEKAAQRHAIFLATHDPETAKSIGIVMMALHDGVGPCERCGCLADRPKPLEEGQERPPTVCAICNDGKRDAGLLCLVARVQDMLAIERSGAMRGRYFVLGKLLNPLEGIGAEDLPLDKLRVRVDDGVREVLLALPASVEGTATALAIGGMLVKRGVKVTRIAQGVSHGAELEWADPVTIGAAIEGRAEVKA